MTASSVSWSPDGRLLAITGCPCNSENNGSWIVPVDACYELVGRIRRHWKGFEGGQEAWLKIDAFFAGQQ